MGQRGCDAADRPIETHGAGKKGEAERKQRGSAVSGEQEKQARGNQHPRRDRGCPVGLAGSGWRGLVHRAEQGERSRGSRHGGEEERRRGTDLFLASFFWLPFLFLFLFKLNSNYLNSNPKHSTK